MSKEKANPAGELRARHLIRWYNRGAGGRIRWKTPGDFNRCVAVASKHMTPENARGFCFAGDTEFLTADGATTFAEAVDTEPLVLTGPRPEGDGARPVNFNGRWVQARIRSFGEQPVASVTLVRMGARKVVRATPGHLWFASDDGRSAARNRVRPVETSGLRPGMQLAALLPKAVTQRTTPSPFGVAAGFTFGDGWREPGKGCRVTLWGDKDAALLPYFEGCPAHRVKNAAGTLGTRISGVPASWKRAPALDEGIPFLLGWLAGYLAADGTVAETGAVVLDSSQRANLELVAVVASRLGIATYPITQSMRQGYLDDPGPMFRIGFVRATVPSHLLVIPEHRRRFDASNDLGVSRKGRARQTPVRWRVESVDDVGEVEEVFCAEVPDTHTFALADYVWVHNCNERHQDAVGAPPGKGHGGTRKALLARLLDAYRGDEPEPDEEDDVGQSVMVALYPPREVAEALALEGGEDVAELHVTLAYLGSDATETLDLQVLTDALSAFAAGAAPLDGAVSGLGRFTAGFPSGQEPWPLYASVDLPALPAFRQRLVAVLEGAGAEVASDHGFTPHLTLAYVEPGDEPVAALLLANGVKPLPLHFGEVVLAWGDLRIIFPLGDRAEKAESRQRDFDAETAKIKENRDGPGAKRHRFKAAEWTHPNGHPRCVLCGDEDAEDGWHPGYRATAKAGPVVKSIDAKRYTLGPMYLAAPDDVTAKDLDAHGEFVTRDDLQAAVWDYVRSGDRSLRLQHEGGTTIGEWVEIMAWPTESEFPLTLPTGETVTKRFPAGTVFMGAVWNDHGWDLVSQGKLRAYSLGGTAQRVAVEVT